MFNGFYQGKKVFVTGHTGFKGGWLSLWLRELGAQVWGYALAPETKPALYDVIRNGTFKGEILSDIRQRDTLQAALAKAAPDLVFHLAAQPLVRQSYARPMETLEVNVLGTANVLESIRQLELPCTVVVVSTDKCYENLGSGRAFQESDPLGGHDPYSMSKGAAELVVSSWRQSWFQQDPKLGGVASARAGNVLGGGDYAAERIVPDCIRALTQGERILVRNPNATRPWQHVLDCLSGYLCLAAKLHASPKDPAFASAFNFGPSLESSQDVRTLVEELLKYWPGQWVDASDPSAPHEAPHLRLDIGRASKHLGWSPTWNFAKTISHTIEWYRHYYEGGEKNMLGLCQSQIVQFTADARAHMEHRTLSSQPTRA